MAVRARNALLRARRELRYEPTEKRIRAEHRGLITLQSDRALLVWEPRRILPSYAVPEEDVRAGLCEAPEVEELGEVGRRAFLHGGHPFGLRLTEGEPLDVVTTRDTLAGGAFRPADPDLDGYVIFDFHALDEWFEENDAVVGHPRDPFHRVDVRRSSRTVEIELGGELLARSTRPSLVFETGLPTRFYLPGDDIVAELAPSDRRTYCAYKGKASYFTVTAGDRVEEDLAWSYPEPVPDAGPLAGLISFWGERAEHIIDGEHYDGYTDGGATLHEEAGVSGAKREPSTSASG